MSNPAPDSSGQSAPPTKRRRTVSHLNEEQIEHKRSIDRRAQRAFRQRTRDCITELETRLTSVTESAARKEAELLAEVHALRSQCRMLERRLDSIVNIASGLSLEAGEVQGHYSDYTDMQSDEHDHDHDPDPVDGDAGIASPPAHGSPHIASPTETQPPATSTASQWLDHGNSQLDPCVYPVCPSSAEPIGGDDRTPRRNSQLEPAMGASSAALTPHQLPATVEAASHTNGFLGLPTPNTTSSCLPLYCSRERSTVSTVLPQHSPPTCPLDRILLDLLHARREMAAQGVHMETILGPQKAIMTGFIDPSVASTVHPISRMLSEVLSTFPNVELPEKMGMFYKIYLTMRWQISPTADSYAQMPTWLRPTVTQIAVPHAAWIDNIPWPSIRDLLIEYPDKYPFEIFSEYYSQNVSVNWRFDDNDATAREDGNVVLHSIFEKHIRNLDNWTVSREFETRFPEMSPIIFARGR